MDQCTDFAIIPRHIEADLCTYKNKFQQYVDNHKGNSKDLLICSFTISLVRKLSF